MASPESAREFFLPVSRKRIRRRHHCNSSSNYDTIQGVNLSDDVLDKILALLPIRKAMQIGILSRRFNNSWIFSRRLDFDNDFSRGRSQEDFISIVNKVFDLHAAPSILSFRLSFHANGEKFLIDKWVKKSIQKDVEELDLSFYVYGNNHGGKGPVQLLSDVYNVESIKNLKLDFCQLDLPPNPKGLHFLKTLVLKRMIVTQILIDALFQNCLLLEILDISRCSRVFYLKISTQNLKKFKVLKVGNCPEILRIDMDAPTLQSIYYYGHVCFIKFINITKAKDVMINFRPSKGFTEIFRVRNIVYDLYHIEVLTTTSSFLEGLTPKFMGGILREMKYYFCCLKEFHLIMKGAIYCNPYDIVSFLKSCQYLEKIFIDFNDFNFVRGPYWELHNRKAFEECSASFFSLKFIKLSGFKFHKYEITLVKFLLERAPYLEKLVLITPKSRNVKVVIPNLQSCYPHIQSWKASPRAEIVVFEPKNDTSLSPMHFLQ